MKFVVSCACSTTYSGSSAKLLPGSSKSLDPSSTFTFYRPIDIGALAHFPCRLSFLWERIQSPHHDVLRWRVPFYFFDLWIFVVVATIASASVPVDTSAA